MQQMSRRTCNTQSPLIIIFIFTNTKCTLGRCVQQGLCGSCGGGGGVVCQTAEEAERSLCWPTVRGSWATEQTRKEKENSWELRKGPAGRWTHAMPRFCLFFLYSESFSVKWSFFCRNPLRTNMCCCQRGSAQSDVEIDGNESGQTWSFCLRLFVYCTHTRRKNSDLSSEVGQITLFSAMIVGGERKHFWLNMNLLVIGLSVGFYIWWHV